MATKKKTKKPTKVYKEPTQGYRKKILVATLVDRSGSMQGAWAEHLNGFKVFIDNLRTNEEVEYFISLTTFDTLVDAPARGVRIEHFNPAILANYGPRGGTALYDALGITLEDVDKLGTDFDKIIFLVVTDGENNSSNTYSKDQIHTMIDDRIKRGNWTFEYFGCQPETWADSQSTGFTASQTVQYSVQHIGGSGGAYAAASSGVNNFANSSLNAARGMTVTYASSDLLKSANLISVKDDDDNSFKADLSITSKLDPDRLP